MLEDGHWESKAWISVRGGASFLNKIEPSVGKWINTELEGVGETGIRTHDLLHAKHMSDHGTIRGLATRQRSPVLDN